ncbi:MAG TPA: RNA polymerase sigma factor [Pyrinomonadaceae bacterium]|nr:RNA polymerase sigma factor [Pyrinomonadaceae bacterium]
MPTEPTDAELAVATRDGDEGAFATLFERHHRRIAVIAGRFFQEKEEIEDVVQESFAKAYFAIKDFSDDGTGSMAGWLSRIAFNTCYDELRRRRRNPEKGAGTLTTREEQTMRSLVTGSDALSVESAAITRDLANKLLSRLSADDRIVLVLIDVEGLSVAEISEVIGWSSAKVKIRAYRARNELRRILRRFL